MTEQETIAPPAACGPYGPARCSAGLPPVLDMCCGPRMMWFDKHDHRAVYIDKRRERHAMNRPMRGTVEWTETDPDQIVDFTALPFPDDTFDHVVFDPPHFDRSGKIGYLAMKYGWLDGDWREMLRAGFAEGFRVLRPGGTLIFKWTATENPVSEIFETDADEASLRAQVGEAGADALDSVL